MRLTALAAVGLIGCAGAAPSTPRPVPPPAAPPTRSMSPAEIARVTTPSVVQVRAPGRVGSGFVVRADGLVVTSLHVVEDAATVEVVLVDGRRFDQVRVVGFDRVQDVVVLAIPARGLPALRLSRGSIAPGEHVVAIGHPHGLANTVSDGLVSSIRTEEDGEEGLQISAPISPGSSGGPVLDDRGRVVGVTASTDQVGQNLNFATPARHILPLLESSARLPLSALPSRSASRLFAGCGPSALVAVHRRVARVAGRRHRARAASLEAAAMDLVLDLEGCPGVTRLLLLGLDRARTRARPAERAAVLAVVLDQIDGALRRVMQAR